MNSTSATHGLTGEPLTQRRIVRFWLPLAATWMMMAAEGPLVAAVIARMVQPTFNLAAYGVAYSLALVVEAPIIMMVSASTALVKDGESYRKLLRFLHAVVASITIIIATICIPSVFYPLVEDLIGLPANVAHLTHTAVICFIPWPAAIGYRRFYQGILIRVGLTRRVAYGTLFRLGTIITVSISLFSFSELPGSMAGAITLSSAVILELIATRFMASGAIETIRRLEPFPEQSIEPMTYRSISSFYFPLALMSVLALAVHPITSFFIGQSRLAIESLAVMPVINSLVFIFRSLGLSFHEVGVALLGEGYEGHGQLKKFATTLGIAAASGLILIALTPLQHIWFVQISGLTDALASVARVPVLILAAMPALSVLLAYQRAIIVNARTTRHMTYATVIEVAGIFAVLFAAIHLFDAVGAVAAASAFLIGRLAADFYLAFPCLAVLRQAVLRQAVLRQAVLRQAAARRDSTDARLPADSPDL